MRYLALATDYDGTLASQGRVNQQTVAALERLRKSGRRLILVSGRELGDLLNVFPEIHLFGEPVDDLSEDKTHQGSQPDFVAWRDDQVQ